MKKFHIWDVIGTHLGCFMASTETEAIQKALVRQGYSEEEASAWAEAGFPCSIQEVEGFSLLEEDQND